MNDRQKSRLFWVAKGSLGVGLLYVAVSAILGPSPSEIGIKPKVVSGNQFTENVITEEQSPAPVDYSTIADNDLFAEPVQQAPIQIPTQTVAVAKAMPSAEQLGLRLIGAIAGGPTASRAIIEDTKTKTAGPYRIGSTVGSATVKSIEPDRVVLVHAGREYVLQLSAGTPMAAPKPAGPSNPSPAGPQAAQAPPSARLGYVEELFREATIKPYVKDGRTEGLEITGLEQTPLAKLFGLRNGDVVRTVNGQNLTSRQKAFQVLKKARTQPKIDLELLRKGKTKTMSFDL